MRRRVPFLLLALLLLFLPAKARDGTTTVAVLGAIHGGHLRSKSYSVDAVLGIVRDFKPEVVLVEIPPYLFDKVVKRIDERGFATRRKHLEDLTWIKAFPELYRGVIPLRKQLGYTVVPVSGWRPEASTARREFWKGVGKSEQMRERRRIYDAVNEAFKEIRKREGGIGNAAFVNSQHQADMYQLLRTCWSACFDDGLGTGGETAINRAHWQNIAKALDAHRGKRVLIVYGAAHRYWFLRELRQRKDVELVAVPGRPGK